jgi:hypothetical protein
VIYLKSIDVTEETHFTENPFLCIISRMRLSSTLSNAFSKSNLRMIISFLEVWHRCKYWKTYPKQSYIDLCLMKPYWFSSITSVITHSNLLASSLVISLIGPLSKEIGLKSFTLAREVTFGTSVMELFRLFRSTRSW